MTEKLSGTETFRNAYSGLINGTVLEFWQWAFSNLLENNVRGIFGEWLVAKLLDIPLPDARSSWAEYDLKTPEGVTIEVKTSAYVQVWDQQQLSKIIFGNLRGRVWDQTTHLYGTEPTYNAHFYVFCVHTEKIKDVWDALDLSKWQFYLLPKAKLESLNCDSLSLAKLESVTAAMDAEIFAQKGKEMVASLT